LLETFNIIQKYVSVSFINVLKEILVLYLKGDTRIVLKGDTRIVLKVLYLNLVYFSWSKFISKS